MKKILVVFGTRPEAIKMSSVIHELKNNKKFAVEICVTGQHKEMLDQVLDLFKIVPDHNLNVMTEKQALSKVFSKIIDGMENILTEVRPDIVLVHGDTTTTLAATLASFHRGIRVGHVEAGLRTGNLSKPWPEEANRRLTDVLTNIHFCPTKSSSQNLLDEGVNVNNVYITGNTVIDALLWVKNKISIDGSIKNRLKARYNFISREKKVILVTAHRRESFEQGIKNICAAIADLARLRSDIIVVFPVHLNPKIKTTVFTTLNNINNIILLPPLDYLDFVYLMSESYLILSDSGGIQEEAPTLGKPVLLMRDETERPEALISGTVKLVGNKKDTILSGIINLLDNEKEYKKMSNSINPFGDGKAAIKIRKILEKWV
ncbi:MAG: non-hydrolyzing UDP-N-acetylglucosamine 2-epimerase [Paracoccaceae bacterium]